ncbi:MAG: thiolase, partial [Chloroflexi bacterium]|nr:thiolase [Chloroflexota bacterium]
IDDPTPENIKIGMAVEVVFDDVTDDTTLPKFKPA